MHFKGFRLKKEGGAQGVIDEVKNRLTVGKVGQIYGGPAVMGVHSHRGCVDDNRCISVPIRCRYGKKIGDGSAQSFGAGGDRMIPGGDVCAQPMQNGANGLSRPSGAQDQNLPASHRNTGFFQEIGKTEGIGVVAVEAAVGAAEEGVHIAGFPGGGGKIIAQGIGRALIGDGHIEPVPGAGAEKILHLLRGNFKKSVVVAAQEAVQQGGMAVRKGPSQQSAAHQSTSRFRSAA